jgi:L-asparaginase II
MSDFSVVATRAALAESVHPVSVAVTDADGTLVARAGDPDLVTYWRSASKPFQLYPLIASGGVAHYGLDREMIALACASHNAEPRHREVGARWLKAIGLPEAALSCGGHPSLWPDLADAMIRDGIQPTPLWSNCSGKHAAMLALAKMKGWPTEGYNARPHPVQELVAESLVRWTGLRESQLVWGVDGCTAAAVALPLRGMAVGYARLGSSLDPSLRIMRDAMLAEPFLIAGTDRLDTAVMEAWPGRIVAKIGAEGVYSAALPELGLGIALKVIDGDMKAAGVALMSVLQQVTGRLGAGHAWPVDSLDRWRAPIIRNTRGVVTGEYQPTGALTFA